MTKPKYAGFGDSPAKPTEPATPVANFKQLKTLSSTSSSTSTSRTSSIAPERDFQRVPNSVTKQAMASGLFRGKSKQVYDYLWSVSRGAIVPVRKVRKSRKEIKAGSGLGSMVTVDAAIDHLLKVGLISVSPAVGSLIGNAYEIYTPEEASTRTSSISSISSPTQNVVELDAPESSYTRQTQSVDSKAESQASKTSFKTKEEFDDELASLQTVSKELTGKSSAWKEVAEVLAAELRIAAARTTVSSPDAFLAEHLRRRLWKVDKKQGGELPPTISQPSINISKCPDCGGSSLYYPEGFDKGVKKCPHTALKSK